MKTLTLETTAPFQGLAELVAYDEGLFEKEGLTIKWGERDVDKRPQLDVTDVTGKGVNRYASHGRLLEEGKADLYNACEWGNYCRVESTKVGSRQIGRRSIVTFAALVVRGDSPVQTPQQFTNRQIGVPFFFGTHYLTLQMLEGFVPRDQIDPVGIRAIVERLAADTGVKQRVLRMQRDVKASGGPSSRRRP